MEVFSLVNIRTALDRAIIGHLCVEAWIGCFDVLLLGLGDEVLRSPEAYIRNDGKRVYRHFGQTPYEVITNFADWWVEDRSGIIATNRDNDGFSSRAVSVLRGKRAQRWSFVDPGYALRIQFEDELTLGIGHSSESAHESDWELWLPDGHILRVSSDGILYQSHKNDKH